MNANRFNYYCSLQHAKEEMLDAAIYLQKLQNVQAQLKRD
jgi:hypothetical protein